MPSLFLISFIHRRYYPYNSLQGIIKVIGVGGGGCNAVRNMYDEEISGVTLPRDLVIKEIKN